MLLGGKKPKSTIVVGNKTGSDIDLIQNKLKGVPKVISLHVYRLDPETTVENLIHYLKPSFPEVLCEKLNSKHPESYSSFKVNLYEEHLEQALDPNLWPRNCCVRRFLYMRPFLRDQPEEKNGPSLNNHLEVKNGTNRNRSEGNNQ